MNPRDRFVMKNPWSYVGAFYFETFPRFKKMFFLYFEAKYLIPLPFNFLFVFPLYFIVMISFLPFFFSLQEGGKIIDKDKLLYFIFSGLNSSPGSRHFATLVILRCSF